MREKQLLFTCKECSKPVYREGKSTNFADELCGLCNTSGRMPEHTPDHKALIEHHPVLQATMSPEPGSDVLPSLTAYRTRLDRVEALSKLQPTLNFAELWFQTKEGN